MTDYAPNTTTKAMTPPPDPNSFLMGGGGARAFSPMNVGDKVAGTIVDMRVAQQTDIQTNLPKFWDNGDPVNQLLITVQTDLRDDDDDDGLRTLYVKGGARNATSSQGAIAKAVRDAKAKALEVGGKIGLQYIGDGEPSKRGFNPPKQYAAQYAPPPPVAVSVESDIFDQ